MSECLLCSKLLTLAPSWKSLFLVEAQPIICKFCSNQFEKAEIREEGDVVDLVTSLYTYNEAMKDYLHQFKFLQDVALAPVFKRDLQKALRTTATIIPIPMHPEKKTKRTFAHIEELLKSADINYRDLLTKVNHEAMGTKTKAERLKMPPLFKVKSPEMIQPKTYILVDDIYTTGTTLRHAATVLKAAGAKRVEAVTLIRAK